jgi:acylphosphatase
MANQQLHAIVAGHVQGIGFRYFVLEVAQQLQLTGWVRNLVNGNVELIAEGNRTDLDKLYSAIRSGSPGSLVINIVIDWLPAENTFTIFSIRPTA